jgi:hypothetical protein
MFLAQNPPSIREKREDSQREVRKSVGETIRRVFTIYVHMPDVQSPESVRLIIDSGRKSPGLIGITVFPPSEFGLLYSSPI